MSDNSEYNRWVSEKASFENQVNELRHKISVNNDKVDRLKDAKKQLGKCYDSFESVTDWVKKDISQKYSWHGTNYDTFETLGDSLNSMHNTYQDNIDNARDKINMEIARLENEIYDMGGLVGHLISQINTLAHKIENYFNSI